MSDEKPGQGHPSAEDMAAYLDGRADESVRARIEAHAAGCAECRREIAEVGAMLTQTGRGPGWPVWGSLAAAAAAIALLFVASPWSGAAPDDAARFRGPDSSAGERAADVRVVAPAAGAALAGGLSFVWHAAGSGTSYQLTLTDAEGGVVWETATTDTVAPLPDTIELDPGATYHWFVDALHEDGWHATSGVHSFTTQR